MQNFSVFDNLALLDLPAADPLHGDGDGQLDGAARPGPVVLAEAPPAAVVALELGAGDEEDVRLVDVAVEVLHRPDRRLEGAEGRPAGLGGQPHGRPVLLGHSVENIVGLDLNLILLFGGKKVRFTLIKIHMLSLHSVWFI